MEKEKFNFNKYNQAYKKENYKRVPLEMPKDYYNDILKPAAVNAGLSVNSFIKLAISEKIERDKNQ